MWACPHEEIQMKSKRQCYVCVCMNCNALCAHVNRLFVYVSFYGHVLWSCGTSCVARVVFC